MTIQWQVLSMHALTSELYMLQCVNKKYSSTCCPLAKHPKHNKIAVTNMREKPVDLYRTGVNFSSRNNFANLGSLAKVSVPVQSIIP